MNFKKKNNNDKSKQTAKGKRMLFSTSTGTPKGLAADEVEGKTLFSESIKKNIGSGRIGRIHPGN